MKKEKPPGHEAELVRKIRQSAAKIIAEHNRKHGPKSASLRVRVKKGNQ